MYFYNKNSLYSTPTTSKSTSFFTTRNALPYDMVNIATTRLRQPQQPQQQPSYGDATVLIPTPNPTQDDTTKDTTNTPQPNAFTHLSALVLNTMKLNILKMSSSLSRTYVKSYPIANPTTLTPDRQPREEQPAKKPRQDDDDDL